VVRYPGQKEFKFASFNKTVVAMDGEDDRIENSKAERDSEVTRRAQECGTRIAAKCGAAKSILLICNL
jgi:hypothetical protein